MRHYEYVSGVQILLRASGIPAFIHSFTHTDAWNEYVLAANDELALKFNKFAYVQ